MKVEKLNDKFYAQTSDGILILSPEELDFAEDSTELKVLGMLKKGPVSFDSLCTAFDLDECDMELVLARLAVTHKIVEQEMVCLTKETLDVKKTIENLMRSRQGVTVKELMSVLGMSERSVRSYMQAMKESFEVRHAYLIL